MRAYNPHRLDADYHFRVRAATADGVWNDGGATMAISVTATVWQTWWFRSIAAVGCAGAILLLVRYVAFRRLRRRVQELEQRSALDRERARIARDIHDDLGHGLTQIVLLSDLSSHEEPHAGEPAG